MSEVEAVVDKVVEAKIDRIGERAADIAINRLKSLLERFDLQNQASFDRMLEVAIAEVTRRVLVVVEQLQVRIGAMVDAIEANERRLNLRIEHAEERLTGRIESREKAVMMLSSIVGIVPKHSEDLESLNRDIEHHHREIERLNREVEHLGPEIAQLREDLRGQSDLTELKKLKVRVDKLDERVDLVLKKPD